MAAPGNGRRSDGGGGFLIRGLNEPPGNPKDADTPARLAAPGVTRARSNELVGVGVGEGHADGEERTDLADVVLRASC